MDIALLIVRLVIGLGMAAHGAQKLFGWFGGYGLAGTGGFFEGLGFKPGKLFAAAAGLGEVGSGLLIALGIGGALGPAVLVMVMLVAIATVHISKGFFVTNGGWELNAAYISVALDPRIHRFRCLLAGSRARIEHPDGSASGLDRNGRGGGTRAAQLAGAQAYCVSASHAIIAAIARGSIAGGTA